MKTMVVRCTRNRELAIIRALASAGHEVIGIDDRKMPLGLYSRYISKREHYDARTEDEEIAEILRLAKLHRPDVLIASSLSNMLVPRADQLSAYTECLVPAPDVHELVTDKLRLYELCSQLGISAPKVMSEQEATEQLLDESLSPEQRTVVIKPRSDFGAGRGLHLISDADKIASTVSSIEDEYGPSVISEFVPGPWTDILAVNLLFDKSSQLVGQFAFEKLRLYPPRTGVSVMARSVFAPELVERLLPLFAAVGWQGPADAEFKIDASTGEARLLEINGRFTGALAFSIDCGIDFPALYCDAAVGVARPCDLTPNYAEGIVYWNPGLFLRSLAEEWQTSGKDWGVLKTGLRQLMQKKVGNPWRLNDPAPYFGKLLIELAERIRAIRTGGDDA